MHRMPLLVQILQEEMWSTIVVFVWGRGTIVAGLNPNMARLPVGMVPTTGSCSTAPRHLRVAGW